MKAHTFGRFTRHLALAAVLAVLAGAAQAQALHKIDIVVFGAPSLGAFLPPVIKARKLDEANGLDIGFQARTPDAYAAQFNGGEFQVGGSAALLTVGLADLRGLKVSYLFNLFDFWGAVVTGTPEIRTLADLQGKRLAAARGTTNFVMVDWFARQQKVDMSKVEIINTATPGLIGYALADRADAVQLWEPGYSTLIAQKPTLRALDLDIQKQWRAFAGGDKIPYLGVAAHTDWIEKNKAVIPALYRTYKQAAEWVADNPAAAANLIAPKADGPALAVLERLIRDNVRLGMNVRPAGELRKEIEAVYRAGQSIGYLPKAPSAGSIYSGRLE
jgi:ABC-type nitrate/sulfonate/bicarbonate transport system substrate-binding protein